jgi:hypothetical protein
MCVCVSVSVSVSVCKLVEAVTSVAARPLVILARLGLNRLENFLALLLMCAGKKRYKPEFSAVQAKLQELHAAKLKIYVGTNPDKPRNHKLDFIVLACVEMHIHEILTILHFKNTQNTKKRVRTNTMTKVIAIEVIASS